MTPADRISYLEAAVEALLRADELELAAQVGAKALRERQQTSDIVRARELVDELYSVKAPDTGPLYVIEGGAA